MSINQKFAKNLKELVESKHISLRKLETELNINHTTLSRWLNAKTLPNADYLYIIADYFNCSVDYLLGRIDY